MRKERTLANIAETAFWNAESENKNTFDRVAKAVEKEVLARLNKSEAEPVAGQELSFVQVLKWIEKHGSTSGLQSMYLNERFGYEGEWLGYEGILNYVVDTQRRYRVAPKKTNNPDDPTTWENGVAIFRRDSEYDAWILDVFRGYSNRAFYKYRSELDVYKYAKLATPEQIEAWKLINDECLCDLNSKHRSTCSMNED